MGSCGFRSEIKMDYPQGLRVLSYKCHAGIGTHLDAPSHFIPGGSNAGDIPLKSLIVPSHVLHVSDQCAADLIVQPDDLFVYEKRYGMIEKGSLILVHTGWGKHWTQPDRYRNLDREAMMHFPTLSHELGEILIKRDVVGVGIDTLSPDPPKSQFPIHHLFLGKGKYILENVASLEQMPPVGAYVINLPLRIREGSESPVRLVGVIPHERDR
jgi:kynurenine formamidase